MAKKLPEGDTDKFTREMGSLYRDDANQRLVQFNNYEDYDDYEVRVYTLKPNGDVERETQYWDDETMNGFIERDDVAYLSGHNFPGSGYYGAFTPEAGPNCPECGKFMTKGSPERHEDGFAVGYTCNDYKWDHPGYMTQQDAIDKGYYFTIQRYLKERYGTPEVEA